MNYFNNLNKKARVAELVKRGLENRDAVSGKEIRDCIYLLENAMGDTWKSTSKHAAAGMVLMALAKNSSLARFLNSCGWFLVLNLVQSTPRITRDLPSGKRAEIHSYQAGQMTAMAS
jgi:hypothetical protein